MRRLVIGFVCLAVLTMLGLAGVGQALAAVDLQYVVTPGDLAGRTAFDNGRGGLKFGYDPDMPKPIGSLQAGPTGFGNSSFYSDVQGNAAGGPRDYTAFRMSPRDIFGVTDVTISDLSAISYYTKWVSDLDWQIKIYTEDVTPTIEWYQTRVEWNRPNPSDNDWHQYTADGLTVGKLTLKVGGDQLIPGTGLLSDLDALYGTEKILFIDIIASYGSGSPPSYSYLDGVKLTLDTGDTATMNLEIPEPASLIIWGLLASGAAGLGVWRRRRRSVTRAPWTEENRQAIREIVDRGRINA